MNYCCYLYLDENGHCYYVGMGNKRRPRNPTHSVPIPDPALIQTFYFAERWMAVECEIELIAFFGRKQDGGQLLNLCVGGPGLPGYVMTEEHKRKIGNANRGRVVSAKQRKQISKTLKGRKLPKKTCAKMSASRTGSTRSEETKRRMSEAMKASWARRKAS